MDSEHVLLHRLRAAEGFLDLGLPEDAWNELEEIPAERRHELPVVLIRLQILYKLERWTALCFIGHGALHTHPDSGNLYLLMADATRWGGKLEDARAVLLSGEHVLREHGLFHFRLGCYECQLGKMEAAKERVARACALGKGWKQRALDEPDLEAL